MSLIKYRVGNIPLWFKPFYYVTSYLGAYIIYAYKWLILNTCRIVVEGKENVEKYPARIESVWHYKGSMYWLGLQDVTKFVQFSHPLWFMYKIILIYVGMGVRWSLAQRGMEVGKQPTK
jgi:hypothetical protein